MKSEFNSKSILGSQTLGDRLKNARQAIGLSLNEASKQIKIKLEYLDYLEKGQYNKLPSPVYIKNYLKKYSHFLKLSFTTVEKLYQREITIYQEKKIKSASSKFSHKALVIQKLVFGLIIVLILAALGVYFIFEIGNFIKPPQLTIDNLPDQITINKHNIAINGGAGLNAQVFINGQEVITDTSGNFREEISLQSGLNNIKITAKKKHSKETIINKQVFVEE